VPIIKFSTATILKTRERGGGFHKKKLFFLILEISFLQFLINQQGSL